MVYSKARRWDARQQVHATHFSQDARKTASWHKRCKGGTLPERKRLAWLLAAPGSEPFSLIQNSFCAASPHNITRMYVSMAAYIAEGRLAPANGRNPGRQDRRAAPVCSFVVPKMGPKTGPQYCWKKERLPKWRPRFCPEPFVCFAGNGLDKAWSKFHSMGGLSFPPNSVSTLRVSYSNKTKGRCLIRVLTLVCDILPANFRIEWLLWNLDMCFDFAGSQKVWVAGPSVFPVNLRAKWLLWHAFRRRRLAQSVRRGFGLQHFTCKFPSEVALVKSWHAFRLRRLAQSVGRGSWPRRFSCKFLYKVALVKSWHAFRPRRLAQSGGLRFWGTAFFL